MMMAKDLLRLDEVIDRCQKRMEGINILRNEVSYITESMEELE